jgi:2-polyprenyl-3-methyl-5-hydroxy-6-metoxy-1,4-benzoquinol methylase
MSDLVVVPRATLARFEDLVKQRIYTNANPLVRWIFWRRLALLLDFSDEVGRGRALDFGCGEGAILPSLCRRFGKVAAVDLEISAAQALSRLYRLENLSLLQARAPELPFGAGVFDFIVAADVLEHLQDLEQVVTELHRLLAPEGRLVVSAPSENLLYELGRKIFGFTKPDDHYHSPPQIEKELKRHFSLRHKRYLPLNWSETTSAFVLLSLGPNR